jgi:hypothetical protein
VANKFKTVFRRGDVAAIDSFITDLDDKCDELIDEGGNITEGKMREIACVSGMIYLRQI